MDPVVLNRRASDAKTLSDSPAQPAAVLEATTLEVTVPEGALGGMALQIQTPSGLVQAVVPEGLSAGHAFQLQLPPARLRHRLEGTGFVPRVGKLVHVGEHHMDGKYVRRPYARTSLSTRVNSLIAEILGAISQSSCKPVHECEHRMDVSFARCPYVCT